MASPSTKALLFIIAGAAICCSRKTFVAMRSTFLLSFAFFFKKSGKFPTPICNNARQRSVSIAASRIYLAKIFSQHQASHGKDLFMLRIQRLCALFAAIVLAPVLVLAQTASHDVADTWQGTLHIPQVGKDLRLVLKIEKDPAHGLKSTFYSIDQGANLPASSTAFADGTLAIKIDMIDGGYEAKLSSDGKSLSGAWKQSDNALPLLLERTTPATVWTIPEPPKQLPPMDPKADPSFEVATVKPGRPDTPGKLFSVRGTKVITINTTVNDLISFAYGVHAKQIVGGPAWIESDKFDIEGQPDVPGTPSTKQLRTMLRKLLTERFGLTFHKEPRTLAAYVITSAKGGPKMSQSDAAPDALPALFFTKLGVLTVRSATMQDLAELFQSAVLDRPVVDQTKLAGRWNFLLKWTPDESQFSAMGVKVPPLTEAADAPPPLFTAIQEQIGLKLEATKTQVDVLVLDKIEKPSAN
jgi:uncharacterized protein (TIGR03435 family)